MHVDPELMSLLALGEEVGTAADRAHVQTCPTCAGEIAELHQLVTLARTFGATEELSTPGPHVWARIQEELALAGVTDKPDTGSPGLTVDAPAPSVASPDLSRPSLMDAVAAALSGPARGSAALVAHATLASAPGTGSVLSGEAVIATDELGRRILQVALDAELPTSGLRHAWLVHRDDPARKQPLGILDGAYGVWTVDRSIDLAQYAIVDISQQEVSETEHSGRSIVRGELALAV
ncbi:hypothetical protein GCM10022204_17500 [Microlunatus aurantiacus]|uniref:Uncharacterized protein n=1 Tax=Microlunatus aurantiacus TaxID=446786 RepID=A0ABP7D645_9ACTN